MLYERELHFARSAAMHAGELALGYQSRELKPESKPDLSPVTIADRECERLIAQRIEQEFPDDGILGEEGTCKDSRSGRRWIVDPIDGTRDFVRQLPLWSVLIGLEVHGDVVAGVSNLAPRKEMYSAVQGGGAWRNDSRISISGIDAAENALICVNGMTRLHEFPFAGSIVEWMSQFWAVRSLGGCLDAMMVASGHAELWIELHAKAWDLAPLKIIAEESGARFMNFDGGSSIYGGNGVMFVPALEPAVSQLLGVTAQLESRAL
jgi:fructose-1,6-bisphosphatase/inositol monophosphatase family enzyme